MAERLALAGARVIGGTVSTGVSARAHGGSGGRRRWARAALLLLLAGCAAWSALNSAPGTRTPAPTGQHQLARAGTGWSALPAAARPVISSSLGSDVSAFWGRRSAGGAILLRNPVQGLSAAFSAGAVAVSAPHGLRLGLSSLTIDRAGSRAFLPRFARAALKRNRVTYTALGISDWFANGPWGVEQGFTLSRRPAGTGPLLISQTLAGNATGRVGPGGRAVTFSSPSGSLRYTNLVVTDATGQRVPARLRLSGRRLTIVIEDAHAVYPLRVDPTFQQTAELTASDGNDDDDLAYSVAVSGSTIVAGAPYHVGLHSNQGAVYVYTTSGGWSNATQTAELTAADGAAYDQLGYSVAVSGSTIVAGAPGHSDGRGAVYVYTLPNSGVWASTTQTAELTASDAVGGDSIGTGGDELGSSVAVSGSTIVAGAPNHKVGSNSQQGAVYVYTTSGGWGNVTQTAELTASDGAADDQLGYSVAVSGSTIAAGAPGHRVGSNAYQGAVYVYTTTGGWGNVTQTAELTASDGAADDELGYAAAVSGSTIVAGAPFHKVGSNADQGAAYEWTMPGGGWAGTPASPLVQTAELTASGGDTGDELGYSVAVSNATIVAGALDHAVASNGDEGEAYVYMMPSSGGWSNATQTAALSASDGLSNDQLGFSIGVSGSTVVAGAPYHTVGYDADQGAAYVFDLPTPGVAASVSLQLNPTSITADGSSTSQATASVTDAYGNPVSGDLANMTIKSDGGQTIGPLKTGSMAGTYQATITATTTPGTSTITATDSSPSPSASGSATLNQDVAVSSVSPSSAEAGATDFKVTIDGAGFENGATASFANSGITVDSTSVVSSSQLTAYISITANSLTGATAVTVTNPDTTSASDPNAFTVDPGPTVISTTPGSGDLGASNLSVTIDGSGFETGAKLSFSDPGITVNSTSFVSSSELTAYISIASGTGATAVTVTNPDGSSATGTGAFVVDEEPVLTVLVAGSQVYGGTSSIGNYSVVGYIGGTSTAVSGALAGCATSLTSTYGGDIPAGTYYQTISGCEGLSATGYVVSYVDVGYTVTPAALAITASSSTMTYGATPPTIEPSYSGFKNSDGPAALTTAPDCSSAVLSSSSVGRYASSCTGAADPNYTISYVSGSVSVTPAPLTITASSASVTYGAGPPAITPSYSDFANGENPSSLTTPPLCIATATSSSSDGSYATNCVGAVDPNYSITYVGGSITVTPAPLTITASTTSMTYGGTVPQPTPVYTGFVNNDNPTDLGTQPSCSTTAPSKTPVGTLTDANTCSGAAAANYTFNYKPGNVTVNPAALTANVVGTRVYGATATAYTVVSYAGFVYDDSVSTAGLTGSPSCSTIVAVSAGAGFYTGTISDCSGVSAPNYAITYNDDGFTVTPAPLTITASSPTITYGQAAPTVTASYSPFVNGDSSSSLTNQPICYTPAGPASLATATPAGVPLPDAPSDPVTLCADASDPNYTIIYVSGNVTVKQAPLTITASSATIVYGQAVPQVAPSYSGFVNNDDPGDLTTQADDCTTPATLGSPVDGSPYPTSCTGAADPNYAIAYKSGSVTVTPAPLTVTVTGTQLYGITASQSFTIDASGYIGFVNGDIASTAFTTPAPETDLTGCATNATGTTPAGIYDAGNTSGITITGCSGLTANHGNYSPITYADGGFTVTDSATTSISTPSLASIAVGGSETDSVVVTGNVVGGPPTGTVSFAECEVGTTGATSCASGGVALGGAAIALTTTGADSSSATSASFLPTGGPGTYCVLAQYSGSTNYEGSSDDTSDGCFTVTGVGAPLSAAPAAASMALGETNSDAVTVTGNAGGGSPTGSVVFYACGPGTTPCLSGGTKVGTTDLLAAADNTATATSPLFLASSGAGTYCFRAVYSGDGNYGGSTDASGHECFTATKGTSSTASAPSYPTIEPGESDDDTVTVAGNAASGPPTGTVSFYVCGPGAGSCGSTASALGGAVSLDVGAGDDSTASSPYFTPTTTGSYCFYAVYSGDANYQGSSDATSDGCFALTAAAAPVSQASQTAPSNAFAITAHSFKGDVIHLTLTLPGPGSLSLIASHGAGTSTLASRTVSVTSKGSLSVALSLNKKAKAAVAYAARHKTALDATVTITYTPSGGSPRTKTLTVVLVKHK